jgi:cell volume regulation protein A
MESLSAFYTDLLILSGLLMAAFAISAAAQRVGLPGPAAFLVAGIVAGLVDAIPTDGLLETLPLEQIGAIALYAILFQGGLSTGFGAWRAEARPIVGLGLLGTGLTAAALAAFGHYALGFGWALAAFVGIALSPTDPAAVYATLRAGRSGSRARVVLEGESGFNDPVGISLMVVAVAMVASDDTGVGDGVVRFVQELVIGLAGGLVGAAALMVLLLATPRLEQGLQAGAILIGALVVGSATAVLHGSGFLAVYVAGLLLSDRWAQQDGRHHAIPEGGAALAEPILFGLLGAAFAPLVGVTELWQGIAVTAVTVLVVRPLVVATFLAGCGFSRGERVLVSWGGLKGAVPLLLAAYPALEALPEADATEALVLVATAASVVVQGAGLRVVAGRLSLGERDHDASSSTPPV